MTKSTMLTSHKLVKPLLLVEKKPICQYSHYNEKVKRTTDRLKLSKRTKPKSPCGCSARSIHKTFIQSPTNGCIILPCQSSQPPPPLNLGQFMLASTLAATGALRGKVSTTASAHIFIQQQFMERKARQQI